MITDYKALTQVLKYRLKHRFTDYIEMIIASDSMRPTLKCGDIVHVRQKDELQVGDIIAFTHCNTNITVHRIFGFTQDNQIITKGDNNPCVDDYFIYYSDVIGVVTIKKIGVNSDDK